MKVNQYIVESIYENEDSNKYYEYSVEKVYINDINDRGDIFGMEKLLKSYYLRPLMVMFLLSLVFGMVAMIWLLIFPDPKESMGSAAIGGIILLLGYTLYLVALRPYSKIRSFLYQLTRDEEIQFKKNLCYNEMMDVWCSDHYIITNMLLIADIHKAVWVHQVHTTFSTSFIPFHKSKEIYVYLSNNIMKPPFGKATFEVALPLISEGEQTVKYINRHNPTVLFGYTPENVIAVNQKCGTSYIYDPNKINIIMHP